MEDIFCRIVKGEIPAKKVFENDRVMAIEDIAPKAKTHLLIFPKEHLASSVNQEIAGEILKEILDTARMLAKKKGIDKTGYRVLTNHGSDAGQSIDHLHFHLLGGEKLKDI